MVAGVLRFGYATPGATDVVAEVLVDGDKFAVVADRIEAGAIMDAERVPEWLL